VSGLRFGEIPPGHVIDLGRASGGCSQPHFDRDGKPKPGGAAHVYEYDGQRQRLCAEHAEQLIRRVQAESERA
jgi:YD repeat-containing protein